MVTEQPAPTRRATRQFQVKALSHRLEDFLTTSGTEKSGHPRPANRPAYSADLEMLPTDDEKRNGTPCFGHLTISTLDPTLLDGLHAGHQVSLTLEWDSPPAKAHPHRGTPVHGAT